MSTIKDAFLKAFIPSAIIKIEYLDIKIKTSILTEIHTTLKRRYETLLDIENNILYLGRRLK